MCSAERHTAGTRTDAMRKQATLADDRRLTWLSWHSYARLCTGLGDAVTRASCCCDCCCSDSELFWLVVT